MIVVAISNIICLLLLFAHKEYLLFSTLFLLNAISIVYLMYGKHISLVWFEKISIKKDALYLFFSIMVSALLCASIYRFGDKLVNIENSHITQIIVYILLLALTYATIKIQHEEKR